MVICARIHLSAILLFIFYCLNYSIYAQSHAETTLNTEDSLKYKTFDELDILFQKNEKDSVTSLHIAQEYLTKAKKINDSIQIATAYSLFFNVYVDNNQNMALQYADSIISMTNKVNTHIRYPATGYIKRGYVLHALDRYDDALQSYLLGLEYAERVENEEQIVALKHNIALLKTTLGKNKEALRTFKENYDFLINEDTIVEYPMTYAATLYKLGDTYNRLKKYDSAHYYLNKGIRLSFSTGNTEFYTDLLSAYGTNSYYRESYMQARDSLQKMLSISGKDTIDVNVRISYLYMAKALLKLGEKSKALDYLKKVESSTNQSNYVPQVHEAFILLIDHYSKNKDLENQLIITNKLLLLERMFNGKYARLNNNIIEKYDIAKLVNDKKELMDTINSKNKMSTYRSIFFGVVLLLIMAASYFYIQKRRNKFSEISDKYTALVNTIEKKKETTIGVEVPEDIKKEILKKLQDFEDSHKYLKNNLTLGSVSKSLKTNSSYLSKVINIEKGKNFANYINDLRIDFCVDQINNNKKFKQYSVRSMAGEVGFNNIQSFAKAFLKRKGCKPAEFIKRSENQ